MLEMGGKSLENPGWMVWYKMGCLALSLPLCLPPSTLSATSLCAFLPTTLPCPHSVLSPVPALPIQVQAPPPQDSDSGSDSDYEHYDFSAQPPVALTTFYSECLGPGTCGPSCPNQGEGPAGWGPSIGSTS